MNPLVADAWLHKGLAFNAMQKYADAVSAFNKVIELRPGNTPAFYHRGIAFSHLHKYRDAMLDFDTYSLI